MKQCSATVGHAPSDFGMVPVQCRQTVAVRSFYTTTGMQVGYCAVRDHEQNVRRRFAEGDPPAWDIPDEVDAAKWTADRAESWTRA